MVKFIFGRLIFIHEPIFKIFVSLFKTFGMHKDDKSYLSVGVIEQADTQKVGFQRLE